MKTYEKPIVVVNKELAESVYMASGSTCYTTTASIHQKPEVGRGDYRIQVDGKHKAYHSCDTQILTISFNQSVEFKSANGDLQGNAVGTTLQIVLHYHNNPNDNIGFGDLIVESDQGLAITGVEISDYGYTY